VLAAELFLEPDVEDQQVGVVEPARDLVACWHRSVIRLERRFHRLQLDLAGLRLAAPGRQAAEEHCNARMPGELRHLRGGHRADAVAAVVENQPLLAGDAVTPEAQGHLRRERLQQVAVAHRRRRAEHQRLRARDVATRVRVGPTDVAEEEISGIELGFEPLDVHDLRQLRHGRGTLAGSR
jgi:hypothetical protein